MQIAADAGIAPMIYYVDEATRVVVMDFIEEKPLVDFPGGAGALVQGLGQLIRRIQATKPFPSFLDYPEIVQRLWQWVCRTGLFAPGVLDPYTKRLVRIRESYDCNSAQLRSSHNDIVPRNVLFDGKRLWLIDWESAYRNHPLVDVAIALDCFGKTPELESLLLQAWLGHKPEDALYAELTPVRALARLYYAGVFLSASFAALGALGDSNLDVPSISEFDRSIREGALTAGTPETKHILGKMYLRSFLTDVAAPGLEAAV